MSERRRMALRAIAVGIGLMLAAPVRAQPPSGAGADQDAAFRSGLDQFNRGNNVGAIATWESLLATLGEERGFKVLYNLGLAYQAIGDVTRAIERYRSFVKQVSARADVPRELAERAADAQSRLEQLERSHGAVNVRAPKRGGLVLTRVGTSEPRAAGFVVWLAPGRHEVELFVGTDHVKKVTLDVVQGKTVEIDTSPPEEAVARPSAAAPASVAPTSPAPSPAPVERSNRWIYVGAAATAISLALPIATYVVASGEKSDAEALGRGNSGYPEALTSFENWKTVHYVSYALPAVLGLATIAYVVFRPSATTKVGLGPACATLDATF